MSSGEADGGRRWDEGSKTPYFHYREGGTTYQVWYDDPESLRIKYQVTSISNYVHEVTDRPVTLG